MDKKERYEMDKKRVSMVEEGTARVGGGRAEKGRRPGSSTRRTRCKRVSDGSRGCAVQNESVNKIETERRSDGERREREGGRERERERERDRKSVV